MTDTVTDNVNDRIRVVVVDDLAPRRLPVPSMVPTPLRLT